ncbi:unnamed protein product [Adineta steineri]|uniref:Uncharacterized protein n=1 Tax=Adineta steineri TaxID=433720 RepID=A0A814QY49_9BILA|nr:unnamed protein product [Adineta steineri]CAF1125802.1 unnamed protein product [Adineta steineri]
MFGGGFGGYGNNPFAGGFGELASDYAINRMVPGGLNSPMGMIVDNMFGGNPNGGMGMGMGMGGGFGGSPFGGGYNGGYGGGYGYY